MRTRNIAAAALIAAGVSIMTSAVVTTAQQTAIAQRASARPTAVATVDLGRVLEGLDERPVREREFVAERDRRNRELESLVQRVQALRSELEALPSNSSEAEAKAEELIIANANLEAQQQVAQAVLQQKQKVLEIGFFNSIRDAVREYAEREGFDIVISDDTRREADVRMNNQQVQALIGSQRVLYTTDSIDITEEIKTYMNNQFQAGGGASGGGSGSNP